MKKLILVHAVVGLLTGCGGGVEWFPDYVDKTATTKGVVHRDQHRSVPHLHIGQVQSQRGPHPAYHADRADGHGPGVDEWGERAEGETMRLISERTLIREVASRWDYQYPKAIGARGDTSKALHALNAETATAAEVNAIIGNDSWTTIPDCDECNQKVLEVVEVGEEPDYESSTARLCKECLKKAISLE